jgi:hypothetical protein
MSQTSQSRRALLASTPLSRQFLADQTYNARAFRQRLAERGALVV